MLRYAVHRKQFASSKSEMHYMTKEYVGTCMCLLNIYNFKTMGPQWDSIVPFSHNSFLLFLERISTWCWNVVQVAAEIYSHLGTMTHSQRSNSSQRCSMGFVHAGLSKPFLHGLCFVHKGKLSTWKQNRFHKICLPSTKTCRFHGILFDCMHLLVMSLAELAQSVN